MTNEILEEFKHFDESRSFRDRLFLLLDQLPLASLFNLSPAHTGIVVYDWIVCMSCRSTVDALLLYARTHSQEDLHNLAYSLCTHLGLQSDEVCAGVIDLNMVTAVQHM